MSNHNQTVKIGIDIGGVIIAQDTDEPDLFFTDSFLKAEAFLDCFKTITKLIQKFGSENVFIISKCGEKVQKKSREWLEYKDFFRLTGFNPNHLNFCLERHEKAPIAKRLGLNYFIDDRYAVLKYLLPIETIERLILFCPNDAEKEMYKSNPNNKILEVGSWAEVGNFFISIE